MTYINLILNNQELVTEWIKSNIKNDIRRVQYDMLVRETLFIVLILDSGLHTYFCSLDIDDNDDDIHMDGEYVDLKNDLKKFINKLDRKRKINLI